MQTLVIDHKESQLTLRDQRVRIEVPNQKPQFCPGRNGQSLGRDHQSLVAYFCDRCADGCRGEYSCSFPKRPS